MFLGSQHHQCVFRIQFLPFLDGCYVCKERWPWDPLDLYFHISHQVDRLADHSRFLFCSPSLQARTAGRCHFRPGASVRSTSLLRARATLASAGKHWLAFSRHPRAHNHTIMESPMTKERSTWVHMKGLWYPALPPSQGCRSDRGSSEWKHPGHLRGGRGLWARC